MLEVKDKKSISGSSFKSSVKGFFNKLKHGEAPSKHVEASFESAPTGLCAEVGPAPEALPRSFAARVPSAEPAEVPDPGAPTSVASTPDAASAPSEPSAASAPSEPSAASAPSASTAPMIVPSPSMFRSDEELDIQMSSMTDMSMASVDADDLMSAEQRRMKGPFAELLQRDARCASKLSTAPVVKPVAVPPSEPPPPMSKRLVASVMDWKTGAQRAVSAVKGIMAGLKGGSTAPVATVAIEDVLSLLFFLAVSWNLLLFLLLRPRILRLVLPWLTGVGAGLALCFLTQKNRKIKQETRQMLSTNLGVKGLQLLLGTLPTWITFTEREKLVWLNSLVAQLWPYYDLAVCRMIKETVETLVGKMIADGKLPGVAKLGFKQLTLGDSPLRVESLYLDPNPEEMWIEAGVRWGGDAKIQLFVELVGSVGDATQLCPKIANLSLVGTLRIGLKPLVDSIPGFMAAVVTFPKAPIIKYDLDFGNAMGGTFVAGLLTPFIEGLVDNNLASTLVWPARLVVPVIQNSPEAQFAILSLYARWRGVVKVVLTSVTHLPPPAVGTSLSGAYSVMTELSTDSEYWAKSTTKHNTLAPEYSEVFYLLVQEPVDQQLKVEVNSMTMFNATDLLKLKVSNAMMSKNLIGRAAVQLAPACHQEPTPLTVAHDLGEGNWSDADGPGKGKGRLNLQLQYRDFTHLTPVELRAQAGILTVAIMSASNLRSADADDDDELAAYAVIKCGAETFTTGIIKSTTNMHSFQFRCRHAFYDVARTTPVIVKMYRQASLLAVPGSLLNAGASLGSGILSGGAAVGSGFLSGGKAVGSNILSGKMFKASAVMGGGKALAGGVTALGGSVASGVTNVTGGVTSAAGSGVSVVAGGVGSVAGGVGDVMSGMTLMDDGCLGYLTLTVGDVASSQDYVPLSGRKENGVMLRAFKLEGKEGSNAEVFALVRFIPKF